ncbi:hypothetical protein IQ260_13225 [Leptolyngbya cf. ectocarpi LEGE 11479]|uniref:Uncharacterized protein n=1 Tax=Leptolyngbya cf. ectocarpi LEGE 11479 TaxID=1828722 RepID=A0A928ZUD8_LEPEC|nr:hypothetical protein [Leptolyngbya ectocarpi]MBE9067619.1 hypothetical protein [Leptolyngbya cf. ectocarpi LEGE 11479]
MSLSKLLRTIILGLISLLGLLILIGFTAWWHDWWYGTLNPDQVRPIENWMLGLAIGAAYIQIVVAVEALLIGLATRLRWIKFKRGRLIVGLFSLMMLSFALPLLEEIILVRPSDIVSFLQYLLYLILPLIPAWCLLLFRRA